MKEIFTQTKVEVISFGKEDIIVTSNPTDNQTPEIKDPNV